MLVGFIDTMFLMEVTSQVTNSWKKFLTRESHKSYFQTLSAKLAAAYQHQVVFPKADNIFAALSFFEINQTKVVILGQDPYHQPNYAHGLAFSTANQIIPASLKNLFLELYYDFGKHRTNSNLTDWAKQGVLLWNCFATVVKHQPLSHAWIEWTTFTQNLLTHLSYQNPHVIYLLMGNCAQSFASEIISALQIIKTSHPSPYSYHLNLAKKGVFKQINQKLVANELSPIFWT